MLFKHNCAIFLILQKLNKHLSSLSIMEKEEKVSPYYALSVAEALNKLSSSKDGISLQKAKLLLEKYGFNEIKEKKALRPLFVFLRQFNSFFVYILIAAAFISFFAKNLIDMYVIIAIILINSSIGFFQEYRAENAINSLKKMIVPYAKVYRDSELLSIPAAHLVQGDIIFLESGDRIPADARLIELKDFTAVESSLTGESFPSVKQLHALKEDTALADRTNMVWMGTFVSTGTAKALVAATGNSTAIGCIARDIESIKKEKSHFQKKTDILAKQMGLIAIISAAVIFSIGFFIRGFQFKQMLLITIASLVAAIPEGLPAILAIILAIGAFRMAKKHAIIRKLAATETLAIVNTIITDKTGTLTQNTMTAQAILLPGEGEIDIDGAGWVPRGELKRKGRSISPLEIKNLAKLLSMSYLCNNSKLVKEEFSDNYKIIGDPTEAALCVLAEKAGIKEWFLEEKEKRIDDLPFNQKLRYRASLILLKKEKKKQIYVIGAPEILLKNSSHVLKLNTSKKITKLEKNLIEKQINALASRAMRVVSFAFKEVPDSVEELSESLINNLTYLGIVGIVDPPRSEVKGAIARARQAGIRVIMATGDHKNTALAIAKEIGLRPNKSPNYPEILTEEDLEKLSPDEFEKAVKNVNLFARLTPHTKLRIASTLQKKKDIVAMTGDGINDAPALKQANVGIAMGIIGTDVARESAEIVLADDNFASIINVIEEGHIVFDNTRQTSFFLVTTNLAEAFTLMVTMGIGLPLPLLPTQILWLNLVTDTGPGIALAIEPRHDGIEEEGPKNPKENILTKEIMPFLVLMSAIMLVLTAAIFMFYLPEGLNKARTGAFVIMALTQLYNTFNLRSLKKSIFKIGIFSNKYLVWLVLSSFALILCVLYIPLFQNAFQFAYLRPLELLFLLVLSSSVLWFGEAYKKFR